MPKIGILSHNTFFPRTGDILDATDDQISWTCERAHVWIDPKTGTKIRYALLVGRHHSIGDTPIVKVVDDTAMPLRFLTEIDTVHRPDDDRLRHYRRNAQANYAEL